MVARVPITPILPRVAFTAASAPGRMTPFTGSSWKSRASERIATAETVLHATTRWLTPNCVRNRAASPAKRRTVASDLVPYGTRAVSPK